MVKVNRKSQSVQIFWDGWCRSLVDTTLPYQFIVNPVISCTGCRFFDMMPDNGICMLSLNLIEKRFKGFRTFLQGNTFFIALKQQRQIFSKKNNKNKLGPN
jgi:hypothetical protein